MPPEIEFYPFWICSFPDIQTYLDPWADMAHAQAETRVHLNLWVGWKKKVSWEKKVFEPHFEGNVGFMQTLWQMIHKEKAWQRKQNHYKSKLSK